MQFSRWLAASAAAFLLFATTTMPRCARARDVVGFSGGYAPGTVVVRTAERSLFYVLGNGQAVRYPVGVGRAGKQWSGTAIINGKYLHLAWTPPAEVKTRQAQPARRHSRRQRAKPHGRSGAHAQSGR